MMHEYDNVLKLLSSFNYLTLELHSRFICCGVLLTKTYKIGCPRSIQVSGEQLTSSAHCIFCSIILGHSLVYEKSMKSRKTISTSC